MHNLAALFYAMSQYVLYYIAELLHYPCIPQPEDLVAGETFHLLYLEASYPQIDGLKSRSTSCSQTITFLNCPGETADISMLSLSF